MSLAMGIARVAKGSFIASVLAAMWLAFALPTTACGSLGCGTGCFGTPDCARYAATSCPANACAPQQRCECQDATCVASDASGCATATTTAACASLAKCGWKAACVATGDCYHLDDGECASVKGCALEKNCD